MNNSAEKKSDYKVVVIGGGTGPFNLLRGLVRHNNPERLTAIYTTWDDGGSTGRLRTELGMLPMGDARRQLLALIPDPVKQQIWMDLFEHRISSGGKEHAVGNLVLTGLNQVYPIGMDRARAIMDVSSKIIPVSNNTLTLGYKDSDGTEFYGEHLLDERGHKTDFDPNNRVNTIFFTNMPIVNHAAVETILEADKIILSPGSLFGSVLPNLLIPKIRKAVNKSPAELFYVLNVMTETGQTDNFQASDHLIEINRYLRDPHRINYIIAHNNHLELEVLEIYLGGQQEPVVVDQESCLMLSPQLRIIQTDVAYYDPDKRLIRHHPDRIAQVILNPDKYLNAA